MPKAHPPEIKAAALAHAMEHGPASASRQYGLSISTITTWQRRARGKESPKETSRKQWRKKNLPAVATEAGLEAPEIIPRSDPRILAAGCYDMVSQAHAKLTAEMDKADPSPKLIHALCGAVKIGAEIGQLLSGKPTSRSESTNQHVIEAAIKINENPEAREYARAAFRATKGNGDRDPGRVLEAGCPN